MIMIGSCVSDLRQRFELEAFFVILRAMVTFDASNLETISIFHISLTTTEASHLLFKDRPTI